MSVAQNFLETFHFLLVLLGKGSLFSGCRSQYYGFRLLQNKKAVLSGQPAKRPGAKAGLKLTSVMS